MARDQPLPGGTCSLIKALHEVLQEILTKQGTTRREGAFLSWGEVFLVLH